MRKFVAILLMCAVFSCAHFPAVYGGTSRYTTPENTYVLPTEFATREYAIACFIRTVGTERFEASRSILNRFSDKSKISLAYIDDICAAVYSGLADGYEDNTLRPQNPITRAEALVILNRALSRTELADRYDVTFSDTPEWASRQIERLAAAGIVKGYGDGTVGAYDYLTSEQVGELCSRIRKFAGPAGDFYSFVNSSWLNSVSSESVTSSYSDMNKMSKTLSDRIADIIYSLYRRYYNDGEKFEDNSTEKRIIDVYSAAANQGYRDRIGISPITDFLTRIDAAESPNDLLPVMADMEKSGFKTLIPVRLDVNIYNSDEYVPAFSDCYIGLSRSLITGESGQKYMDYYREYLSALFRAAGEKSDAAEAAADSAAGLCLALCEASGGEPQTDGGEISAELFAVSDFQSLFGSIDLSGYLSELGYGGSPGIMVYSKGLVKAAGELFSSKELNSIKAYLKASVLDASALYLNTEMFSAYQQLQNRIEGTASNLIPSDYAVSITQEIAGWEVGSLYIEQYFPETAKTAVTNITKDIIAEYEKLLAACTRITPQTRSNAIGKLKAIKINAAYPENFDEYTDKSVSLRPISEGGSLMEYKMSIARAHSSRIPQVIASREKAERGAWLMYPQTVNAMYDPVSNSITIPAGMLQAPFFDFGAAYEENLGGIGAVIAHEISHAFDSVGAKFDSRGNLSDWWTEQDHASFKNLCSIVEREYSAIPFGGGYINGKLTMNENIADIAGMSCIISLASSKGLGLDTLFRAYAKSWRTKTTAEYDALMLVTDVHSPPKLRVNRVLSNFHEFEDVYNIIDGDGMYIPDENKISIWK